MTTIARQTLLLKEAGDRKAAGQQRSDPVDSASATGIQVELVSSLRSLEDIKEAWTDLAARALEANITLTPAKALAAIRNLQKADRGCAVLVWQSDGDGPAPRRLLGLFPLEFSTMRWGVPVRSAGFWWHFYSISGTPLVDRRQAQSAIAAFVGWLKTARSAPRFLRVTELVKGPVYDILTNVLAARGMAVREYDGHERAILDPDRPGEDYLRESLGKKRSKEYRRVRNRLVDLGQVTYRMLRDRDEIEDAIARFIALEKSGWKGERGTALACRDDWRAFFTDTVLGLAETGDCRIAELSLDGRVIASTVLIVSQDVAWMWKIAFDEMLSRYSPGVLLVLDVTEDLIADKKITRVDSCAVADHPMINRIWRERLGVVDLLVTTRSGIVPRRLIEWLEQMRRDARVKIKTIYKRLTKETHHG